MTKRIAAKAGERGLHELHGIISAPTLRPDGSLLATPGFDTGTGLLLLEGSYPAVSLSPSRAALAAAWETLWHPFREFPYVTPDDRAVTVAAILTAIVRRTLPLAPAFSFDAPVAGSGKTILATCIAAITGGDLNSIPKCKEEDELRKRLIATLLEGHNHMLLDNIKGMFRSSALEAFMTGRRYSDRILGISKMANLPTNVLVLISGNNFVPASDLSRRVLTCRIDPRVEDAFRRSFELDAVEYCVEHRQKLIAAGLTLLLGFQAAGAPRADGTTALGSFEAWDKMVRQAVLWMSRTGIAELGDPIACINVAKDMDPERMRLVSFLTSVRAVMGDKKWRTAELIAKASTAPLHDVAAESLRDTLVEIAGSSSGSAINPRILGAWIQKNCERRVGALRIGRGGIYLGSQRWAIHQD